MSIKNPSSVGVGHVNPYLLMAKNNTERLAHEKRKLEFLHETEQKIKRAMSMTDSTASADKSEHLLGRILRNALYFFLLAFGLFEDGAGSYLFATTLFILIPGISNPVVIALSALFAVLNCILFYAFEVSFLKEALNLKATSNEAGSLIETYQKQLEATIAINQLLTNVKIVEMSSEDYDEYSKLAILFNQDLQSKKTQLGTYQESIPKKILKWGVVGFGVLSTVASSYFMASSLLAIIAAPILGTPIGWTLILLTIVAGLGFYYAMGVKSMIHLVKPDLSKFNTLKTDLQKFTPKTEEDFTIKIKFKPSEAVKSKSEAPEALDPRSDHHMVKEGGQEEAVFQREAVQVLENRPSLTSPRGVDVGRTGDQSSPEAVSGCVVSRGQGFFALPKSRSCSDLASMNANQLFTIKA